MNKKDRILYTCVRNEEYGFMTCFQSSEVEGKVVRPIIEDEYFSLLEIEDILGYKLLDGFPIVFQASLDRF